MSGAVVCTLCGEVFTSVEHLQQHTDSAHIKTEDIVISHISSGVTHTDEDITTSHTPEDITMPHTDEYIATSHTDESITMSNTASELACDKCEDTFTTSAKLRAHKKCHVTHKCATCKKGFTSKLRLDNHCQTVHGFRSFNM